MAYIGIDICSYVCSCVCIHIHITAWAEGIVICPTGLTQTGGKSMNKIVYFLLNDFMHGSITKKCFGESTLYDCSNSI